MASQYDHVTDQDKPTAGFSAILMKRSFVIDADSRDPLGTSPEERIPAMTPMAEISGGGGKYAPIRRTLADGGCLTNAKVVPVTETTMFAVGDVVRVVAQADPTAASDELGTIDSISDGVSITLEANAVTAVVSGDIIEVAENALAERAVILREDVDVRNKEGTAVDSGGVGVIGAQLRESALNYCTAGGICLTRLRYELDQMDIVPATVG